jgi:hypothetical protein
MMKQMTSHVPFPALPDWAPTRNTLHAYAKVLGAVRRAFTPELYDWQHVSLRLYTAGLTTTPIPHPSEPARSFALSMDLRNHYVLLTDSVGEVQQYRIAEGYTATELGNLLLEKLAEMGVEGEVLREKFDSDEERRYALDDAERYFSALSSVGRVMQGFLDTLPDDKSALQLWPHGLDLAFFKYGDRVAKYEEEGQAKEARAKIGAGFSPPTGDLEHEYFYVYSFPHEEQVTEANLPAGASWHLEGWKGAMLPYGAVAEQDDGAGKLREFLQVAYDAHKGVLEE